MREDMHTTAVAAAAAWQAAHAPDMTPDPPRPEDIPPPSDEPGEPGIFADAFRTSVAEVRRIRSRT